MRDPAFTWGYAWTKTQLHAAGLVDRARRRGAHRRKRERKPWEGMMLHQDGSRHAWPKGQPEMDLIVTMDDAASRLYSAFLIEEEGTMSSLQGLGEVCLAQGLPCSLYTDRGSHYFHTPVAGGEVDKTKLTKVGRALQQLGIEHIAAYSPEARGRSERMFGTLKDRLVKELALQRIEDIEAANRWIKTAFLPDHNRRFAKPAAQPERAFVEVADRRQIIEALCIEEERIVARDNTVVFGQRRLQIEASPARPHYVKARVRVREYPDGTLGVFHRPRCIARFAAAGQPLSAPTSASMAAGSPPRSRRGLPAAAPAVAPARRPSLTAAAPPAGAKAWVGTKKRAARPNKETSQTAPPAAP